METEKVNIYLEQVIPMAAAKVWHHTYQQDLLNECLSLITSHQDISWNNPLPKQLCQLEDGAVLVHTTYRVDHDLREYVYSINDQAYYPFCNHWAGFKVDELGPTVTRIRWSIWVSTPTQDRDTVKAMLGHWQQQSMEHFLGSLPGHSLSQDVTIHLN